MLPPRPFPDSPVDHLRGCHARLAARVLRQRLPPLPLLVGEAQYAPGYGRGASEQQRELDGAGRPVVREEPDHHGQTRATGPQTGTARRRKSASANKSRPGTMPGPKTAKKTVPPTPSSIRPSSAAIWARSSPARLPGARRTREGRRRPGALSQRRPARRSHPAPAAGGWCPSDPEPSRRFAAYGHSHGGGNRYPELITKKIPRTPPSTLPRSANFRPPTPARLSRST